jgi:hypothetical protein
MFYLVAGRTILIEAHDDWSRRAVLHVFSGWYLASLSQSVVSKPDAILRIRCGAIPPAVPMGLTSFSVAHGGICHTDNKTYYVEFNESLITFGPGASREVDLWVNKPYELSSSIVAQLLSHALSPALRRSGIFEIHSAGVVPPGSDRAAMIAGPSGCGKSTLTTQLAKCGWGYLSDDILLLQGTEQKVEVHAFRRFFALTANTLAAAKLWPPAVNESSGGLKERITPQEHFQTQPIQQAIPGTIIFSAVTQEDRSRIEHLSEAESMTRLLRLCPWASYDIPTSGDHLRMLGWLAKSTSAFVLLAGIDILENPKLAAEVVYRAVSGIAAVR